MTARSFDFTLDGDDRCWAASYTPQMVSLYFNISGYRAQITLTMSPDEAFAMVVALVQAAVLAENTLPTGLGESEAA